MRQLAALAQGVYGGGAHRQPLRCLAHGQELVRLTRDYWQPLARVRAAQGQGGDKLLGIRWYDMGSLDFTVDAFQRQNHWLRMAVNAWTLLPGASQTRGRGFDSRPP